MTDSRGAGGRDATAGGRRVGGTVAGRRVLAAAALATVLVFVAAFVVLSSAINWPASLDLAPEEALPLVVAERSGLLLGYGLYLAYSLAILPLAVLLPRGLGLRPGPLVTLGIVVGVVSAVFRGLGIARWLTAMPVVADSYVTAAPDSATREAAVLSYVTLNEYAGGLGEIFGVALVGGSWLVLLGLAVLRAGGPWWLWSLGLLAGVLNIATAVWVVLATPATLVLLAFLVATAVRLLGLARAAGGAPSAGWAGTTERGQVTDRGERPSGAASASAVTS